MSLTKLWSGADLDGYLQDNADSPDATWVFQHIPKTAGSSFRGELAKLLKPQVNICVGISRGDASTQRYASVQQALDAFLARPDAARVRFASGHLHRQQVAQVTARLPKARLITMLRRPETRVISDFRYCRTPKHPTHREFIQRYPTLESYVQDPNSQNRMFEFLRRGPNDSVADVLHDLEMNYAFVGTSELYNFSRRLLFRLIGLKGAGAPQAVNKTVATPDNDVAGKDALVPMIRRLNQKDHALFAHVAKRLRDVRATFTTSARTPRTSPPSPCP